MQTSRADSAAAASQGGGVHNGAGPAASTPADFARFRDAHLAQGFDEVIERAWLANQVVTVHTHPFSVKALVVDGEMWLTTVPAGEQWNEAMATTRHLVPGDEFELTLAAPHAERYGASGATYWAARKRG